MEFCLELIGSLGHISVKTEMRFLVSFIAIQSLQTVRLCLSFGAHYKNRCNLPIRCHLATSAIFLFMPEATVTELNLFWWKLRKNSTLRSFVTVCFINPWKKIAASEYKTEQYEKRVNQIMRMYLHNCISVSFIEDNHNFLLNKHENITDIKSTQLVHVFLHICAVLYNILHYLQAIYRFVFMDECHAFAQPWFAKEMAPYKCLSWPIMKGDKYFFKRLASFLLKVFCFQMRD